MTYDSLARELGYERLPLPSLSGTNWRHDLLRLLPDGFTLGSQYVGVLLDVDLDENGHVLRCVVVTPPHPQDRIHVNALLVHQDRGALVPTSGPPPPFLGEALCRVVGSWPFRPARRGGQDVAFQGFRMTVGFGEEDFRSGGAT